MSVALTSTWQPHNELPRLKRLHPMLMSLFESITIVLPPTADEVLVAALSELEGVYPVVTDTWPRGRHVALQKVLKRLTSHLLYCDLDRLIRWAELHPDELAATVARVETVDCLVIGRTERALMTHPLCLRSTEQLANDVFAHVTGLPYDICVATRGFSHEAAVRALGDSRAENSLGVDGEWIVLCQRAGMRLGYVAVEGMDWETADQLLDHAADAETQRRAAEAFDVEVANWAGRVRLARAIIGGMLGVAGES
ncbi:MAG: hypothetical protein IT320_00960 [Anaerolineae bacterium]|nr:hypothetical protein [Anaerolineae bacterium]